MSSSAYYRLCEDPIFVAEIDAATALFARRMAAVIARAAARMGSWRAAAFWLERRLPESYGPKVELHVDDGLDAEDELDAKYPGDALDEAIIDLQRQALAKMSDADLDAIIAAEIERRKER